MKNIMLWIKIWVARLIALALLVILLLFFVENSNIVEINYLVAKTNINLSIVLYITFATGVLMAWLILLWRTTIFKLKISQQKHEIKHLEQRIEDARRHASTLSS